MHFHTYTFQVGGKNSQKKKKEYNKTAKKHIRYTYKLRMWSMLSQEAAIFARLHFLDYCQKMDRGRIVFSFNFFFIFINNREIIFSTIDERLDFILDLELVFRLNTTFLSLYIVRFIWPRINWITSSKDFHHLWF